MRIRLLFLAIMMLISAQTFAQTLTISDAAGWLESAWVKWQPVEGAESYNVYYSGEGITSQKIDDQLIRNYGTYFRADVPGLKAGTYTIKVVPVIGGIEGTGSETGSLTVGAYDRSGYGFWNGRVPGAYKADGTPKDGAVILYVTENSKNKISLEVTGANANPCVGLETILEGFKKGKDNRPLIVRLVGQVTDMAYMDKGDIVIENTNNASGYITFEGIGDDAVADGWGIRVKNASNVEIRNIGLMNCNSDEGDDIGLQQDNDYVWVHNCDFFYGEAGSDADQVKGDGALDCKKSTYVTFSYNHFWDSGKSNLLGLSEDTTSGLFITYHHNWYDHSDSRHPRVRFYSAHVYNNYYDGNSKYGVGATSGSSVFVEANYFRNCKYPMLISMQGSDVYNTSTSSNDYSNMPTFSKEDGGIIKAFNNFMIGQHRYVAYGASGYPNSTVDFDAYQVENRADTVPGTVVTYKGAKKYNNFDTNPSLIYAYTADSPEAARDKVVQYAGRVNGGDLKWTFDNSVDDASDAVNAGLKAALEAYKTSIVSIQGDSIADSGSDNGDNGNSGGDATRDMVHNFTLSGTTSTFYTITGNLSTSKGTVEYAGLTLTQCLKMESATNISFTTTQDALLTLVFNSDFTGKIKINEITYNAKAGIDTLTIPAGSYQITKGDVANLYYMSVVYPNSDNTGDTGNTGDNTTGIVNTSAAALAMYPNPVTSKLTISTDSRIDKIKVYSLKGVLIKTIKGNVKNVDMSGLASGSYLVVVFAGEETLKQIIIKK